MLDKILSYHGLSVCLCGGGGGGGAAAAVRRGGPEAEGELRGGDVAREGGGGVARQRR
jgi:hypothetical protein